MILLTSNAEQIFWLGRYLTRVQYLCAAFPFVDDDRALQYSKAFALPAYNVESLNTLIINPESYISFHQQFQLIRNNILDLRGVLDKQSFASLQAQMKILVPNFTYICEVVETCHEVFQSEQEDIFVFYSLGVCVENLDHALRLGESSLHIFKEMQWLIDCLQQKGWSTLNKPWQLLKTDFNQASFHQFCDQIQYLFEVDV
ncbi:hypothetical protein [Acinetobacter gerneri]|jgi:hypothetical protein|uniref:DUF403 domain-containing protein n=1 Tax=Acinetobacter gerneri DSM 14967 = CIP 107464 = MTCC 9824 TaxID=1120926 RepID=N8ZM93_9GAMM|nr:hypothetical protein [Acinetobacter gerneri]ENV32893.1 hypothetical protein F960_03068 [Acinetobacter gerneri DSM 14967 = CIP 107464 = MTCC 9824]EPR85374.1 hypothetical protein L289_1684 [Acinetobacter gerneri DSM 14967 = CIP 107464 = MTCC 9824]MCH4242885.1 hypothetical protein [Acinetobacter gerneri]